MCTIAILAVFFVSAPQGTAQAEPAEEIMWRKLDLSHRILDALVLEDFEALEAYGEDLVSLGHAGEWFVSESENYRAYSRDFAGAASALQDAARRRRGKAAAMAHFDLILQCVRCHGALSVETR